MSIRFLRLPVVSLTALALLGGSLFAQASGPDLVPPKAREKVVEDAGRVAATRGAPVELPNPVPNPFVAKAAEAPEAPPLEPGAAPAVEPLSEVDLLARLASLIPATGTVILGGEAMLLLGQKRLKEGDTYTIGLDGRNYEVSIAGISSTSFIVKRGELRFSRPTRLTDSPISTPSSRP